MASITHKRASSLFEESPSKRPAMDEASAATTIQQAYRAHRHKAAIQPEIYDSVKREDFSKGQWEKFKVIASDLQRSGYAVFAHGSRFPDHALFTDIRSHLASEDPAFHSSWNTRRALRSPNIPLLFQNTQEYFESDTCKKINEGSENDGYPNNRDMLSVDGYLDNRCIGESAYYFYSKNTNMFKPDNDYFGDFLKDYIQPGILHSFFQKELSQAFVKLKDMTEPFTTGQGRLYLIAIAKEVLENPEQSYAWRSHAYGIVCTCHGEHTVDKFTELLEKDQKGDVTRCNTRDNPQYRLLTANLERDSKAKILSLDSITPKQKETYANILWPLAHLIKNCRDLESLSKTSSYEDIHIALLRIRFDFPNDQYKNGLKAVLKEKMLLLAQYHNQITQDADFENFFKGLKELDLLDDFAHATSLYENYPSEIAKIQENGLYLKEATEELKNNNLFVLLATQQNPDAILYAGTKAQASIISSHRNFEEWLCIGAKYGDSTFMKFVLSDPLCSEHLSKYPNSLIKPIKIAFDNGHKVAVSNILEMISNEYLEYLLETTAREDCQELFMLIMNPPFFTRITPQAMTCALDSAIMYKRLFMTETLINAGAKCDGKLISFLAATLKEGEWKTIAIAIIETIADDLLPGIIAYAIYYGYKELFELLANSSQLKRMELDSMYKVLLTLIENFSKDPEAIKTLMQACSNGTNPILSISKEDLLHKAIENNDTKVLKALNKTGVFSYSVTARSLFQIGVQATIGKIFFGSASPKKLAINPF